VVVKVDSTGIKVTIMGNGSEREGKFVVIGLKFKPW
jgi:hypothetical protein